MVVYLNCYIWGEGYTLKCFDDADGMLEEFSITNSKMPQWEKNIFLNKGALLFLGTYEQTQFGCVRELETGTQDEQGRNCYYNIAFEEQDSKSDMVRRVLLYARLHYPQFVRQINQIIDYDGADYLVSHEKFQNFCQIWKETISDVSPYKQSFLIPEKSAEFFFHNTKAPMDTTAIEEVLSFQEILPQKPKKGNKEDMPMKLFFYCQTPSAGYVLKQIDFETGEVLCEREDASKVMSAQSFALMTRSGAGMALYNTKEGVCFVAKKIRSKKKDHYGRQKFTAVVFEAENEQKQMLCQFATWALLDFEAFSEQLTDCIDVYDGPREYEVNMESLQKLFEPFQKEIVNVPSTYRTKWKQVVKQSANYIFRYLVLDGTFDYFTRSTELRVKESQVSLLIQEEQMEEWKKTPLKLLFTEDLYKAPVEEILEEPIKENANIKSEKKVNREEAKNVNTFTQTDTSKNAKDNRKNTEIPEDAINLLDYKWFKAILVVIGIVLVAVVIFLIKQFVTDLEEIKEANTMLEKLEKAILVLREEL